MRLLWLADVLREAGLTVVEVDGWKTRGAEYTSNPLAVICHETQGSATSSVQGELNVLINGREGLAGPIAQMLLTRAGVWYVAASGRCNQVKTGWGGPLTGKGNSYSFGVEAMHAVSEDWARKPAQYESYVRGVAAICRRLGWQPDGHVIGHKEHQPGDKSDPEFSMPAFRNAVGATLAGDDMFEKDDRDIAWADTWRSLGMVSMTPTIEYQIPGEKTKRQEPNRLAAAINGLTAQAAADETRDKAVLAAVQALATAGGVDAAPIVAAIQTAAAQTSSAVADLQARISELEAALADRDARLAAALTAG